MTSYQRTAGLTTSDIQGATCKPRTRERRGAYPDWNEPLSKPRRLHPPHYTSTTHINIAGDRPVQNLTNRDIEGSWPTSHLVSSRHTDPLDPKYLLPTFEHRPYTPPIKAARNLCLDTTDIEGTAPTARFQFAQRDHIDVGDIEGTVGSWKPLHTRFIGAGGPRPIGVADINDDGRFKTGRHINPLAPRYNVDVANRKNWPVQASEAIAAGGSNEPQTGSAGFTIGSVERSFPAKAKPARTHTEYSMTTHDLPGGYPGWKKPGIERRQWTNTNYIADIDGTSNRHTKPFSNRHTNPVDPDYSTARGVSARRDEALESRHPILARGRALPAAPKPARALPATPAVRNATMASAGAAPVPRIDVQQAQLRPATPKQVAVRRASTAREVTPAGSRTSMASRPNTSRALSDRMAALREQNAAIVSGGFGSSSAGSNFGARAMLLAQPSSLGWA